MNRKKFDNYFPKKVAAQEQTEEEEEEEEKHLPSPYHQP